MKNIYSLYIHIPFCESKCDYCDFYSEDINRRVHGVTRSYLRKFLDTLIQDIYAKVQRYNIKSIPTVYIGGGTPSVLGTDIKILLDALNKLPAFKQSELKEFTIEANPESLSEDFLAVCREGGANRLSLGVQTFYEASRLAVNRTGSTKILAKALSLAKEYFKDNLSIDLITGLPFQTKETVIQDINKILDYDPSHVSLYSLTVEKGTKLEEAINKKTLSVSDTEEAEELWLSAKDMLIENGFTHYEVSNFAREGFECKHNIRYWRMESWLGVGPSASGTIIDDATMTAVRYTNNKNYSIELHELSRIEFLKEIIMMGYRYCEGPNPKWGAEKLIPNTLEKWKNKNIMLFLNSFLIDAFEELEHSMQTINIQDRKIELNYQKD